MFDNTLNKFTTIATVEGYSFLILLFIAMPMKYMFGIPIATKIVGMIHGGLFIWYIVALWNAHSEYRWSLKFSSLSFIASLIPFGTFFLVKELKKLA